jgi:serine/threonine protein kinase
VHRDLNPSNIMINKNYGIKLVDFGLSKNLWGHGSILEISKD